MPGLQEMLVIGVVALLVFGPDRLPEVARNVGRFVGKLRSETDRNLAELKNMTEIQDLQRELGSLRRELDGATQDIKRELSGPVRGHGVSSGTSGRMVGADQGGGRPIIHADHVDHAGSPTEAGSGPTLRASDAPPPPTDPDAT